MRAFDDVTSEIDERSSERMNFRTKPRIKQAIQRAAALSGMDDSAFTMNAAYRSALETIAAHDILRLKGFADVKGSAARLLVQAVGPRLNSYFDRPWKAGEARGTELVVIGEKHMDRAAIAASLKG